jgi:hypothetical protein
MDTGTQKQGTNPGVKRGCLIWVGLFFLVAFSLGLWFLIYFPEAPPNTSPRLPPLPYRAILAFGAGFIGAIPGIFALAALDGIRSKIRERTSLLKASTGTAPEDGLYQTFQGRILATGPMLVAPLSGRECLLYHYKATKGTNSRNSQEVTHAEGYALTPSYLDTPRGRIRLYAFMELELPEELVDTDPARKRLAGFLPTVELFKPSWDLMAHYRETQKHLLDSDGIIQFHKGQANAAETAADFREQIVQHGDEVAVFGLYSAARGGIVPDPGEEILHRARLYKGSLPQMARGFTRQAVVGAFFGILFAAALWGWIYLFFKHVAEY